MIDVKKVLDGWERCQKCNMSLIATPEERKAYLDCEYTVGLYCGKYRLTYETIEALKKVYNKVVCCKDCKYGFPLTDSAYIQCTRRFHDGHKHEANWFCGDAERKEQNGNDTQTSNN